MDLAISLRIARRTILPGIALAFTLSACEKPKLRSDGTQKTVEATHAEKPVNQPSPPAPIPKTLPPVPSSIDPAARAREYAQIQKRLDAQLVGIRGLESDLARHSAALNQWRGQLQAVRTRQAGAGSGGLRIERVDGASTLIDRKSEARELEAKIKVDEPLVAQFSKALQEARQQYATLQKSMDQLVSE